jgi:acyl-coenzyme A thioesterase PaaI-like protein
VREEGLSREEPSSPRRAEATPPRAIRPTTAELRRRHPIEDYEFEPHRCFACGELNEHGLQLVLHADETGCWTELTLDERFQGWDSVAHGGIVATILDEVMAWSVIGRGTWGVTARLNLAFRKAIPTGKPIRAEGWVVDDRRRIVRTAGHVLDGRTRKVLATGEGTFMATPADRLAVLQARYRLRARETPATETSARETRSTETPEAVAAR